MYRADVYREGTDLQGFDVEATDGSIGKVDEATTDRDHLIVDTGFWIFGKRRLLPAGVVKQVNYDAQKVFVDLTKAQVKDAPDLDESVERSAGSEWSRDPYNSDFQPFV